MYCRVVLSLVVFATVTVQAQHADILIARDSTGTRLVTGTADIANGNYVVGQRVFEAEFDANLAADPGYNGVANPSGGIALPGNTSLNFNFKRMTINSMTSNLFYWNGVGTVNFVPVTDGTAITASRAGGFSATVDGSAIDVSGFSLNTTTSSGFLHRHLDFEITGPATEGIYLVAQEMTMSGYENSDYLYIVFNQGMNESAHEDAVLWVETFTPVPEPTGIVAILAGVGCVIRFRRRLHK